MGNVATLFKVYVDSGAEESVSSGIKKMKPKSLQLEEVAFGIKVIKVLFVHTDEEGSTPYEEKLKGIKGVNEVEVEEQTLL
jgi:translation elongation factor EF-1beta